MRTNNGALLNLNPLLSSSSLSTRPKSPAFLSLNSATRSLHAARNWTPLLLNLKGNGRFSCLFSDNRGKEQARKALESALGGKKAEYEKWGKEIKRSEEAGVGIMRVEDLVGPTVTFFWQEAQQASLAILGIVVMYLIIAKGEVMLAVIFNPLLYALRGSRDCFAYLTLRILGKRYADGPVDSGNMLKKEAYVDVSAKESVLRKWGSN